MYTDLWNHALALYARPGVETACLDVQAMGGDVCLLLCATWLQAHAVTFSEERAKALRGELPGRGNAMWLRRYAACASNGARPRSTIHTWRRCVSR
jgi:Protein of unknown function (DUF2390).